MSERPMSMLPRFKEVMKRLNISREEIAKLINRSVDTIRSWENGTYDIPLKWLLVIASKYNISLDYLFGITDEFLEYSNIIISNKKIGENLVKLRRKNRKKAVEVFSAMGLSQPAYSHYEKGRYLINTKYLCNLILLYDKFSIDEDLFERKKLSVR